MQKIFYKMKKIFNFLALTMLMVVCVGFSSCSKDDEDGDIVGKWLIESANVNFSPCTYDGWIEFKNDGTFTDYDACSNRNASGTWTRAENQLRTNYDYSAETMYFTIVSLSKDKLVLEQGNRRITFKRTKL